MCLLETALRAHVADAGFISEIVLDPNRLLETVCFLDTGHLKETVRFLETKHLSDCIK